MFGEQRKSFRILTPLGHERAILRAGYRQYDVRLVDESLGGFAISCDKPIKAALGDCLTLRTAAGLHSVELVRLERFSDGLIMGLHRLGEVKERPEQSVGLGWLALAAVTGMLLVVACKPYFQGRVVRWELPTWTLGTAAREAPEAPAAKLRPPSPPAASAAVARP